MALAVPLSRFASRVGGGSAFYVRHRYPHMDSAVTKESKLKKLDRELRFAGLVAVAIAIVVFAFSIACYFPLWHYVRSGVVGSDRYDSMVYALKLVVFAFVPCIGVVILSLGVHILFFLHRRKSLLKDDHDA